MNAAQTLLAKIRAAFDATPAVIPPAVPVVAPVTLASKMYKLVDGTEISITMIGDVPSVGDSVTIMGTPAAEGVLALEDGSTISVDAAGVITAVVAAPPVTTDLTTAPPPPAPVVPTLEQRISILESELIKYKTPAIPSGLAMESDLQAANARVEKLEKIIPDLFALCEELSKEPTADPKTLTGAKKEKFDQRSRRDEKFERIATALKTQKVLS